LARKTKILFLSPYPFDEVASQRFRFELYFSTLEKKNFKFLQKSFYSKRTYKILYQTGKKFHKLTGTLWGFVKRNVHILCALSVDYVFIHREATPLGPPVYEWILAKIMRKKIIYDFDDAIWLENTSQENRFISKLKMPQKVFKICKWSHKVSCCNEYLASNVRKYNAKVSIIPTTLDTRIWNPIKKTDRNHPVTLGWTGTHSTLPYLLSIRSALEKIIEQYPQTVIRIICNKRPDWKIPNLEFLTWNRSTEIKDLAGIDIGMMPLPSNPWTKGKCGFKILQYFALGIPAVASPVGLNNNLISHGKNGYLCTSEEEWISTIDVLINSQALREKTGNKGRDTLDKHYSLKVNATNFLDLFE
jgi:glycosyltransferase involved in cell wall biosynthesis